MSQFVCVKLNNTTFLTSISSWSPLVCWTTGDCFIMAWYAAILTDLMVEAPMLWVSWDFPCGQSCENYSSLLLCVPVTASPLCHTHDFEIFFGWKNFWQWSFGISKHTKKPKPKKANLVLPVDWWCREKVGDREGGWEYEYQCACVLEEAVHQKAARHVWSWCVVRILGFCLFVFVFPR